MIVSTIAPKSNADQNLNADANLPAECPSVIEFPKPAKQEQADEDSLLDEEATLDNTEFLESLSYGEEDETEEQPLLGKQQPLEQEPSDEQPLPNDQEPIVEPKPTTKKKGKAKDELTKEQKDELNKLEKTIKRGQTAFFKTCEALREIESKELFRPYRSLPEYCAKQWEMSGTDVSRYLNAGRVLKNLEGFDVLPKNEAQARELRRSQMM